jgi:hypothetical protein
MEIYRAHLRGISHYDLAVTYGITPRTVTDIVRRTRQEGKRLSAYDPLEVVEELVDQIDAGISELAAVAAREKGSARVTAVTNRIRAIIDKGKWLQSSGLLPQSAREMTIKLDADQLAGAIMTTLDTKGLLTPEITEAMMELMGVEPQDTFESEAEELPMLEPPPERETSA